MLKRIYIDNFRSLWFVFGILVVISGASRALAGQASDTVAAFEVATVRPYANGSEVYGPPVRFSPNSLTIHGTSLKDCIRIAFQIPVVQMVGPDWLNDVRLDIVGKASEPVVAKEQLFLMLKTLLSTRMGVRTHLERREMPVYVMTVAKGGPRFSASVAEGRNPAGEPPVSVIAMNGISMSELADGYAQMLGRPVINRTGLSGLHNINFDMSPYAAEMAAIAEEAQKTNQVNLSDAASIMIPALQKQLGLTLEKRRETVDILVVDQAERMPTDN